MQASCLTHARFLIPEMNYPAASRWISLAWSTSWWVQTQSFSANDPTPSLLKIRTANALHVIVIVRVPGSGANIVLALA